MKASESSEHYVGKVRECCNYAVRSAKNFADSENNSTRQPGGPGEAVLRETLQKDLTAFSDEVDENLFHVKQKAYVVGNIWTLVFMVVAAFLGILSTFVAAKGAAACITAAAVFSVLTLLASFGVFGQTSKSIEDINVFAKRKPEKKVKHRIILQANLDAPYKRNISRKSEILLEVLKVVGAVLYLVFDILLLLDKTDAASLNLPDWFGYLAYPLILFVIVPILIIRSVKPNSSFPGVSDNLSGCYAAAGALRYLSEEKLRLQNTEFDVLLTSAKSSGAEGARAFLKNYENELKSVDTTIICLDSLYSLDSLNTTARGRKLNRGLATAVDNAGVTLTDHKPKYHITEANIFRKAKIPTILISSLPDEAPEFYRSADDDASRLDVRTTEAAIKIALETAFLKDDPDAKF